MSVIFDDGILQPSFCWQITNLFPPFEDLGTPLADAVGNDFGSGHLAAKCISSCNELKDGIGVRITINHDKYLWI